MCSGAELEESHDGVAPGNADSKRKKERGGEEQSEGRRPAPFDGRVHGRHTGERWHLARSGKGAHGRHEFFVVEARRADRPPLRGASSPSANRARDRRLVVEGGHGAALNGTVLGCMAFFGEDSVTGVVHDELVRYVMPISFTEHSEQRRASSAASSIPEQRQSNTRRLRALRRWRRSSPRRRSLARSRASSMASSGGGPWCS